ncbi:hypothetical protein EIP91_010697 [Steccherinum ochraceum]|uniref:Tyr recombinase domain-containing protein n=1 Tax=Steccherinum ochraceum TaxID=92696 RepID=A0A4R0R2V5_9APHY|nr:hypothetical protein EIP91_010697 [Steccherinum ochraceum]
MTMHQKSAASLVEAMKTTSLNDIADEEVDLFLEENKDDDEAAASLDREYMKTYVHSRLHDFPEVRGDSSSAALQSEQYTKACRTEGTWNGHERIINEFLRYKLKADPNWDPMAVTAQTPYDIRAFITQKCGRKEDGFEGCKYATAVSTRAALTMWYRSIRRNESTTEWIYNEKTGECRGLPTRSRAVAEYMVGLEKTKRAQGEQSRSMCALRVDDMHRLRDHCFRTNQSHAERRWGIMRYSVYLIAFLMVLRMDEALRITFENSDNIMRDTQYSTIRLGPRKSAQTENLHSWRLCANDQDEKLCPKRTFMLLAYLYRPGQPGSTFVPEGPVFNFVDKRGMGVQGRPLTTTIIQRALAADLQAIGYSNWALYGTHSFRRGGCQYRVQIGWTISEICAWGGWTQVEAVTMYRYFYSPSDNHEYKDEYDRNLPKA